LHTYDSGNEPQTDGNEEAARATFNGGAVAPGGESTQEIAPTTTVWVEYLAPGGEMMQGASVRRIDGGGLLGGGGSVGAKSAWGMALFIWETHLLVEDAEMNSILSLK
jgi:hypothetical protein